MTLPKIQPLPDEIQALVDKQMAIIAQCDGELAALQKAVDNWTAQRTAARVQVKALKAKYAKPDLAVWPAPVDAVVTP